MRVVLRWSLCLVGMCLGGVHAVDLYPGGAGWALRFDGINDFVILSADMPPAPRTIEFWVHPMELRDGMGEVYVHYNSAGSIIGQASMSRGRNLFLIVYNGVEVWHAVTTVNDVHTANLSPGEQVLYHYAWVEEEGNYSIYINGVLASAYPSGLAEDDHLNDIAPLPWLLGARAVYSGGDYVVDDRCFGGVIDEVRWWSVARTQNEIQQYMQKPVPDNAPGLVRQWTFDAGHDLTDGESYSLGGGDHSRAPKWVPSPVQTYGAPKSMEVMDLAEQHIDICAVLVPASPNASVQATLRGRPRFGHLNISQNTSFELLPQEVDSGRQSHCAPVLYTTGALNDTEAYEEIMFDLLAELSNGEILQTSQMLAVRILANLAPIAGIARAVETNGKDNYVSMGLWNLADDWSMSIWVYPNAVVENAEIISRHLSDGTNIFLVEYFLGGYYFRVDCVRGCWHDGYETPLTSRFTAPPQADDELVYDTGLTGAQVRARRSRPQHIAITFRCITRGSESVNTHGEVKIYSDGMLIGVSDLPVCVTTPLDPLAYGSEAYVPERPAPWELGAEYDGGLLHAHQENVAVTPSNFFNGVFDELIFWNRTLTPSEVQASAEGGIPGASDIVVHYTFDEDDLRSCDSHRFWQPDLECFGVNEEEGRAVPQYPFTWTNSLINGARHIRSPFAKVKGSAIHVVMARGSCQEAKMEASDPNGDAVYFELQQTMETANGRVQMISHDTLGFCDHLNSGRRDVEVHFDACDEHGLCASSVSGLGKVIFHIFDHGPEIIRYQGLPSALGLRIAFSEPTNAPEVHTAAAVNRLLEFDPPLNIVHGQWEPQGMFLWVYPDHATALLLFSNNGSICLSADGSCPWIPQNMTVSVKAAGVLRDADRLKFVSTSRSPPLEDATCEGGKVFFSNELDCLPCPSGQVARKQGSEQICSPCLEGDFQVGSECEPCPMGQWSNQVAMTACRDCLVDGAISGLGSRSPESCFCPQGTYEERKVVGGVVRRVGAKCLACPEGMECVVDSREVNFKNGTNGTGEAPAVVAGYMSLVEEPLRVYLCKGVDFCPGGPPGSCSQNRDSDSVACGICKDGYSEMGFSCVTCDDTGYLLLPLFALIGVAIALMIVVYMVSQDRISESSSAMGPTIIAGLTVTAIQTLAVFDNIALVWGEPIKSFLALMAFVSLDINFLRTGCLIGSNPLVKLVFAQLIVPTLAVLLTLILLIRKYFFDRSLHLTSALSNGVGSIYLLLFTTIVLSAAKPFVCYRHPGGEESSMNSAPSVLCFDGNTEHGALVTVSFVALLIGILPFITVVLWGSFRFPYYVSGHYDRGGLKRFNFLYRRFQPWAYYFSSILLVRSLCVCMVPVLIHDEPGVHALLLAIVLLAYAFFQSTLSPWRNVSANLLDNWMSGMMVLLLILGMLTTDVNVDETILKVSTSIFLAATIAIFVGAAVMSLYAKWRPGIAYHRFICHHKAGAAAQARHLQMLLSAPRGPGGAEQRCFIDSDHLKNLDTLFDIVRSQLRTLVIFLTRETLRRPWCAGEVTTAYRAKIDAVVVHMPDCDACPWIQDPLNDYVHQPVDDLVAAGITAEDMTAAFKWVYSEHMPVVEPNLSLTPGQILPDIAAGILRLPRLQPTLMHRVDKGAVHIVSNPTDVEATATANIFQMILNQEAAQVIRKGIFMFCGQPDLQIQLTEPLAVIFVLTAGCLSSGEVVQAIARTATLPRIPVHASGFVFPTLEYYSSTLPNLLDQRKLDVVVGIESMQGLFKSISVPVTPAGSLSIIKAQALEVIHRISSPGMDPVNSNKLSREHVSGMRHAGSGERSTMSASLSDLKQTSVPSSTDRNEVQIVIPPDSAWHWRCTF